MRKSRLYLLLLAALAVMPSGWAQYKPGRQLSTEEVEQRAEGDTSRWQVHGSLFAGVYAGGGLVGSYSGLAPRVTFQASDNLWLSGTLFAVGGQATPSLAPYRGGRPPMEPQMHPGQMGLMAYGASVDMRYKTKRDSWVDLHFTVVDDRAGLLTPYLCSPFYHTSLFGMWDW